MNGVSNIIGVLRNLKDKQRSIGVMVWPSYEYDVIELKSRIDGCDTVYYNHEITGGADYTDANDVAKALAELQFYLEA
jgi:hypothetical protein